METNKMNNIWHRYKKWIISGIVILVLAAGGLLLSGRLATSGRGVSAGTTRAKVTVGDIVDDVSAGGEVVAGRAVALSLMTSGTVAETLVKVGDHVSAGDALLRLETTELERTVTQAEQAVIVQEASLATLIAAPAAAQQASAEADVRSAQAQLDDLLDGPSAEELAAAEANLHAAQADLGAASARLNSATAPADENALRAAQIALDTARAAATTAAERHSSILVTEPNQFLDADTLAQMEKQARAAAQRANADLMAAQQTYDALVSGNPSSIAASQASVASAAAQRDAAQAKLDSLLAGPSDADVAAARSSLAQAEWQLEQLVAGPTAARITSAEIAVEQARIRLERSERTLAEATLLAPFDGVITAVNVQPGGTAAGVVIEIVDPNSLELVLQIDEIDMAQIAAGQVAEVTMQAWPNETLSAEVVAIAPRPVSGGDLVVYEVYLRLDRTDLALRAGMTADATLTTGELTNVLLLPSEAIEVDRNSGTYRVQRVTTASSGEEIIEVVKITVGRRSGDYTQITGGLAAGDEVVINRNLPAAVDNLPGNGPFGGAGN